MKDFYFKQKISLITIQGQLYDKNNFVIEATFKHN